MNLDSKYRVVLLDVDGNEICDRTAENKRDGKEIAAYLLGDAYPDSVGTTHLALGTHKVEVRDGSGQCVLDFFAYE